MFKKIPLPLLLITYRDREAAGLTERWAGALGSLLMRGFARKRQ
jgi:hypothetical protein